MLSFFDYFVIDRNSEIHYILIITQDRVSVPVVSRLNLCTTCQQVDKITQNILLTPIEPFQIQRRDNFLYKLDRAYMSQRIYTYIFYCYFSQC